MSLKSCRGVTLLELLLAVTLVSASVAMLSLTLPKATQALINSRRRWFANNFATSKMQEIRAVPYAMLDPTPRVNGSNVSNFPVSGSAQFPTLGGCNCAAENIEAPAFLAGSYTEAGIVYNTYACINLADRQGGAFISMCSDNDRTAGPSGADRGLKNIRVRVSWNTGTHAYFTETESMITP